MRPGMYHHERRYSAQEGETHHKPLVSLFEPLAQLFELLRVLGLVQQCLGLAALRLLLRPLSDGVQSPDSC
jgi:hypothetical protein